MVRAEGVPGSVSARLSARWTGLKPRYVVRASSAIDARSASSTRFAGWRPQVAVDEPHGSLGAQPVSQPPDLPDRQAQVCRRIGDGQLAGEDMSQDQEALLRLDIQRDRLPRLHGIEGDKVAVPLARTESLASDTPIRKP
jgi:hypothetical protein